MKLRNSKTGVVVTASGVTAARLGSEWEAMVEANKKAYVAELEDPALRIAKTPTARRRIKK